MRRSIFITVVSMFLSITLFFACSENPYCESVEKQSENELIEKSKLVVQGCGSNVLLPVNNSGVKKGLLSRSLVNGIEAEPLWDESQVYYESDKTILIVPLESGEIRSRIMISNEDEKSFQYAIAKSFLIIVHSEKESYSYVRTCLPENNYVSFNLIDPFDFVKSPEKSKFTGLMLNSTMSGHVLYGKLYNGGTLECYISKNNEDSCSHDHEVCDHDHIAKKEVNIQLYLKDDSQTYYETYTSRSETQETCPICGDEYNYWGFCKGCSTYYEYCTCDEN